MTCKSCGRRIGYQHVDEHGKPIAKCSWHLAIEFALELVKRERRGEESP